MKKVNSCSLNRMKMIKLIEIFRDSHINLCKFNFLGGLNNNGVIPELSPETDDSISQMCQQLTQGITALSDDPFASAPMAGSHPTGPIKQHSMPATFHTSAGMYISSWSKNKLTPNVFDNKATINICQYVSRFHFTWLIKQHLMPATSHTFTG